MTDTLLQKVIAEIPQQPQRQYDTETQFRYLKIAAVRLGLYDAADALESWMLSRPGDMRK